LLERLLRVVSAAVQGVRDADKHARESHGSHVAGAAMPGVGSPQSLGGVM
jgi:hypothetical protein